MNSILNKNPYEYLKLDTLSEYEPVQAQSCCLITEENTESVYILTSVLPDGHWCYGYSVYWKNGRYSHTNPDPSLGLFASQREAQLYALGFMSLYAEYFTEATNEAILQSYMKKLKQHYSNLKSPCTTQFF